jgi:hypothetical protein
VTPRILRALAAGAVVVYCATPTTLRPLIQLLTTSACAQRAEALAQAAVRADALSHILRRS